MQAQLIDRTHYDSQRYLFFFFFSEYWNTKRMNKAHWKLTCGRFIESTNKKVSMKANIDCKRLLKKIRLATRTRRQTTVASLPLGNLGNRLRAHEPMQSLQKKNFPFENQRLHQLQIFSQQISKHDINLWCFMH